MTKRREFLKRAAASVVASSPLTQFLVSCNIIAPDAADTSTDSEFHYFEDNLVNLHFYFINASYSREKVTCNGANSYMVVRIPAQHVSEELILETDLDDFIKKKKVTSSSLSGFTFLAFRLIPEKNNKVIRFEHGDWLNWNRPEFQLVTPRREGGIVVPPPTTIDRSLTDFIKDSHLGIKFNGEKSPLEYYRSVCAKLFTGNFPVTVLEIPTGLFVSPFLSTKGRATFSAPPIKKEEYIFRTDAGIITRSVKEVWNTRMWFDLVDNTKRQNPILRGVGYFITPDQQEKNAKTTCAQPEEDKDRHFLPTLLDKQEIVYLTALGNKKFDVGGSPYTIDPLLGEYDIQTDGLIFSGLGAIARLHYKNYNPPNECDLVEYEHHISLGRDEYIKVARLGAISVTGQRAVHIKIGQRKIRKGISYMEFKEFVEIIQETINYDNVLFYPNEIDKNEPDNYSSVRRRDIGAPYTSEGTFYDEILIPHVSDGGQPVETHFRRYPFRKARAVTLKSPPIKPTNELHFWVQHETQDALGVNKDVYFEFDCADCNKKSASFRAPFLFVRKRLIDCQDPTAIKHVYQNFFSRPERRTISFNQQLISFTHDYLADDSLPNRSNTAPTESLEYYFGIAKEAPGIPDIFLTRVFPLYPQMLRANVSIESLDAITPGASATVIQYHNDYVWHAFLRKNADNVVNKGKLIFNLERPLRNVFDSVGDKLGGVINPDIAVDAVGLLKQGITLPRNINDIASNVSSITSFDPKNLMRGVSPEIFGGIKLLDILAGQLSRAEAPQFDVANLSNQVDDLSHDPLFNEINADVQQVRTRLEELKRIISTSKDTIEKAEADLAETKDKLRNGIVATLETTLDQIAQLRELSFLDKIEDITDNGATQFALLSEQVVSRMAIGASMARKRLDELEALKVKIALAVSNNAERVALEALVDDLKKTLQDTWIDFIDQSFVDPNAYEKVKSDVRAYMKKRFDSYVSQLKATREATVKRAQLLIAKFGSTEYTRLKGECETALKAAKDSYSEFVTQYSSYAEKATSITRLLSEKLSKDSIERLRTDVPEAEVLMLSTIDMFKLSEPAHLIKSYEAARRDLAVMKEKYTTQAFQELTAKEEELKTIFTEAIKNRLTLTSEKFNAAVASGRVQWDFLSRELTTITALYNATYEVARATLYSAITSIAEEYKAIKNFEASLKSAKGQLETALKEYEAQARAEISGAGRSVEQMIRAKIEVWKQMPVTQDLTSKIQRADRLIQLMNSLKRKEFNYKWETTSLRDKEFGIIVFKKLSNPDTKILVSVKTIINFSPNKFPAVIDSVETTTYNSVTNFGIGFMKAIMINFREVSYSAGTGQPSKFDVKIRDVQFEGAFSFVQKLQSLLSSLMGDAFRLQIQPLHVSLSYVLPIPAVQTPAFSFFNLSLRFLFRLHFTKRPMQFGFSLASRDEKFSIAVGIFAGFGYFEVLAEPGKGVTDLAVGMEFGGFFGISIGPLNGFIKLAVGISYLKNPVDGIVIEGYFVCEGGAKLWFIMVNVRFYMGVRSQNNMLEGRCSVSYSLRLGPFFELSFSTTYYKRIAGATPNNSGQPAGFTAGLGSVNKTLTSTTGSEKVRTLTYTEWVVFLESYKD